MLRLQVPDMSCGHCVQAITEAVKAVDPAAEVTIDISTKAVAVATSAAGSAVRDAIRGAGYTPTQSTEGPVAATGSCCGSRG